VEVRQRSWSPTPAVDATRAALVPTIVALSWYNRDPASSPPPLGFDGKPYVSGFRSWVEHEVTGGMRPRLVIVLPRQGKTRWFGWRPGGVRTRRATPSETRRRRRRHRPERVVSPSSGVIDEHLGMRTPAAPCALGDAKLAARSSSAGAYRPDDLLTEVPREPDPQPQTARQLSLCSSTKARVVPVP